MIGVMLLTALNFYHAIYISVTEIGFSDETNKLNISVKIFTNDLEDGIYNLSGNSISLRSARQLNANKALIGQYINKRFVLKLNEVETTLELVKSENEGDATWSYFKTKCPENLSTIEVQNQILTELFATQSNVVSVEIKGDKRFLRFMKGSKNEVLEL